jgi:CHAT domain-containing protein
MPNPQPADGRAPAASLQITVVNGDLTFIRQPLVIGHYRSLRLTGTERVMNRLVGGAMEVSLAKGLYPETVGAHQIFVNTQPNMANPLQPPRPEAVIVVGLGEEGKLTGADLVQTVRQSVIGWAQRVWERSGGTAAEFELAATLIGSGGTGIAVGQSAQLVAQGVYEANERLNEQRTKDATDSKRRWPRVNHLHLVELYLDRATEAWRAVRLQAEALPGRFAVSNVVHVGLGALHRPLDSGYRGVDYDFITAETESGPEGEGRIAYTLDTKRARTEVRAQATQSKLLKNLVTTASNHENRDPRIGRTLFQLLVPVEMEPFLAGTTEMQIELDNGTAGIPWELLDAGPEGSGEALPWAIRTKLLRKLQTIDFRSQVRDATGDASALIIGEPECDPKTYRRLPGAREEARAVEAQLKGPGGLQPAQITALISPDDPLKVGADARTVINTLLAKDWRIVHIAGHGEPPEKIGPSPAKSGDTTQFGDPRGVVLSNETFLGPREIRNMRTVPELVFVNCCYLAGRDSDQLLNAGESGCGGPYNRSEFAAGVADALISLGVRCVIAAGWAVEDDPAKTFATTFYEALLGGDRFIDAVGRARHAAYDFGGNTWAAYQCYGDPDWRLQRGVSDAQQPASIVDEYAGVASPRGLVLALNTLEVRSKFQGASPAPQRAKVRHLETQFAELWGGLGDVAEAFGAACVAAGDVPAAIAWYDKALAANDGSASLKTAEQRANLHVRQAWNAVHRETRRRDPLRRRLQSLTSDPAAAVDAVAALRQELEAAEKALAAAAREAETPIGETIRLLETLVALRPTMERHSLLGSAFKRRAMIEAATGNREHARTSVVTMAAHYNDAIKLGVEQRFADVFYPALNGLAGVIASAKPDEPIALSADAISTARESLRTRVQDDPDFWSLVGVTELQVYEAIAAGTLADQLPVILAEYQSLHTRIADTGMWGSVYDQAQFVLPSYRERASERDRAAVDALVKQLEGFAGL